MEHYQKYLNEGYTEEQAFYLAEIKTTQQILTDLGENGIYMPTLLINSLLPIFAFTKKLKAKAVIRFFLDGYPYLNSKWVLHQLFLFQ